MSVTGTALVRRIALLLLVASCAVNAGATERKAYKYVDEKGNITYSQVPPQKDAKSIDITPAYQGRGGYAAGVPITRGSSSSYADDRREYARQQQRQREEAEKARVAQLEAECNRSRGTDCKNPDTLRYMESERIPRGRR